MLLCIKKQVNEIQEGDVLYRTGTGEECEVKGVCVSCKNETYSTNFQTVVLFHGFAVSKKLMRHFFKNHDGEFKVKKVAENGD